MCVSCYLKDFYASMKKYVTITDIAKQLGVSHSTVSRALSDHPRISDSTKKKVKELAKELGYLTNVSVKNFMKGESYIIGVLIPDLSISFFAQVLKAIQKTLAERDYSLLLFDNRESAEEESRALQKCMKYRVDGVISAITTKTVDFSKYEELLTHEVPLVFFDRVANFLPVPKVIADDYLASLEANKHLIQNGCKCIAHITGTINLNNSNNRLYGYLDALSEHEIESNEDLILYYEFDPDSIDKFIDKTLMNHPKLDGISTFNDYTAYHAVQALERYGKKVPEDVSVIGFSNEPIATYMRPKLSTVEQVAMKMGTLAATKMTDILSGNEEMVDEKIVLKPDLIIRDSS